MALKAYKTLLRQAQDSFIIHKSRFIGHGCPCETEEEALAFLSEIRERHKDANHNCYAYIIGPNMGVMRYSDDGEPGGTAGMPIIEVMKARGVTNCAVVVTRCSGSPWGMWRRCDAPYRSVLDGNSLSYAQSHGLLFEGRSSAGGG